MKALAFFRVACGVATSILAALPFSSLAQAEDPAVPQDGGPREIRGGGIFSFVLENDLVANTDRYYTNGARLSYLTAEGSEPAWLRDTVRGLPLLGAARDIRIEYALGQNMYTPRDITDRRPDRDDQPYAGWLYASVGVIAETGATLDQASLSFGIVGPGSLAEETQTLVHEIRGAPEPRGWDTQLRSEPTVQLTFQRSWRAIASGELFGFAVDATPHFGGAAGNAFVYGNTGLTVRMGQFLPNDYGPPRVQPSLPGSGYFRSNGRFGWYLFAGIDGRVVGRNLFLDGNSFRDGRSVEREIFVGDLQAGLALVLGNTRIAYTHVLRTQEFEGQDDHAQFGSISLSVGF